MTAGTAPRRTALHVKALTLALALAAVVLLGGCGSGATTAGSGADAAGVAATGAATQASSAQPTAEPSPARTPQTPQPTPSATPTGSTASGGAGKGASGASSGATTVVFVDVGQGDASVIKSGSWTGLIDGGPPGSEPAIEAALAKLGVRRLSAIVVSHMHADHTGGLPRIVSEWRPRTAYLAGTPTSALAGALRGAGTTVVQVRRGAGLSTSAPAEPNRIVAPRRT